MKRLFSLYSRLVKRRPFLTQVATAGILTTSGDVVAQLIEQHPSGYNPKRTAVMSAFGFFYFGPLVTVWLRVLRKLNLHIALTVACDQTFAGPAIAAGFVFLHPILSQKGIDEAKRIFKKSYFEIVKTSWLVWIPAQSINFSLIPFEFRMLFIQAIALAWNTFLSYRSNVSLREIDDKEIHKNPNR